MLWIVAWSLSFIASVVIAILILCIIFFLSSVFLLQWDDGDLVSCWRSFAILWIHHLWYSHADAQIVPRRTHSRFHQPLSWCDQSLPSPFTLTRSHKPKITCSTLLFLELKLNSNNAVLMIPFVFSQTCCFISVLPNRGYLLQLLRDKTDKIAQE